MKGNGKFVFTAALFLYLPFANAQLLTSPRATAMGSYIAVSDDAFGLEWNASALSFADASVQFSFINVSHSENILEDFNDLGILVRLGGRHTLAYRKTRNHVAATGLQKIPVPENLEDVTAYDLLVFSSYERNLIFGYAFRFSGRFALGVDASRQIYNSNLRSSSRWWSFGFSATYNFSERLRIGLVARNTIRHHYKKHRDRLILQFPGDPEVTIFPLNFDDIPLITSEPKQRLDLGLAARPFKNLLLAMDIYSNGGFGLGLEWEPLKGFFLRQGYSLKKDGLFQGEKFGVFSPGIGFEYGIARFDLTFYNAKDQRDLVTASSSLGEFEITPSSPGRLLLVSALFHVK